MSDPTRKALAHAILNALCDSVDEYDAVYIDKSSLSYTCIDGRVNMLTAADALLAEFLIIPRSTAGTECATVSVVREGEAPGELLPICTMTDANVDFQTHTTGSRVYLAGSVVTSDTDAMKAMKKAFSRTPMPAIWLVWGREFLRVNGWHTRSQGGYVIECSQASDTGYAQIDGVPARLRLVEPSPPTPVESWLPAERARAIRDLIGDRFPRPSVLVPDWGSSPIQLVQCDPWSPIPLPEGG